MCNLRITDFVLPVCPLSGTNYLYFKTKTGVAGLIFEPHPPYFEKNIKLLRCLNDVEMIFFDYLYWFQFSNF